MTPAIRRYLLWYVLRRRTIALICAMGWLIAFCIIWTILFALLDRCFLLPPTLRRSIFYFGAAACVAILARPTIYLFRRLNPVATAVEIESRQGAFDQRLITLASSQDDSELLNQLVGDVEKTIRQNRSWVSMRPALSPALAVLAASLLLVWFVETDKPRPSGSSLNHLWQIWTVNRSGK